MPSVPSVVQVFWLRFCGAVFFVVKSSLAAADRAGAFGPFCGNSSQVPVYEPFTAKNKHSRSSQIKPNQSVFNPAWQQWINDSPIRQFLPFCILHFAFCISCAPSLHDSTTPLGD
jgi:hypothetical protein